MEGRWRDEKNQRGRGATGKGAIQMVVVCVLSGVGGGRIAIVCSYVPGRWVEKGGGEGGIEMEG